MRKNVTEYLDITEGLYSEKIAVEDANGCITFGEMKRNALKIAEFCVEQNIFKQPVCVYLPKSKEMVTSFVGQVKEMLETFNNETEFGRLYIDYPMVESIRYTKQLPDANYWTYSVTRSECGKFKGVSADFSAYDSFDFILLKDHREPTEEETKEIKQNWEYLKEMNVGKANYLCKGKNSMPASKEDILQDKIFNSQLKQYVNTEDCKVAVLNAFPIFLFDYFK